MASSDVELARLLIEKLLSGSMAELKKEFKFSRIHDVIMYVALRKNGDVSLWALREYFQQLVAKGFTANQIIHIVSRQHAQPLCDTILGKYTSLQQHFKDSDNTNQAIIDYIIKHGDQAEEKLKQLIQPPITERGATLFFPAIFPNGPAYLDDLMEIVVDTEDGLQLK